ncbi:MAG: hypothetical protein WCR52_13110 [Bacteroidota bacterium]
MKKKDWKDDVFRSLEGIQRAEPGPELLDKIKAKTSKIANGATMQVVRRRYLVLAAACLALLVLANVQALNQRKPVPSMSSAYQVDNANFDLYDMH